MSLNKYESVESLIRDADLRLSRPEWDTVRDMLNTAYERGTHHGQATALDMVALNALPDGTRVEASNGLVYTKVEGAWAHDVTWQPHGTEWCDCGRFPLSDELPATVLNNEEEN